MLKKTILLTGVTGYVGGRLLKLLEKKTYTLRCLVRDPSHLQGRCDPRVEVLKGDVLDKASIIKSMQGVDVVYYLVHSMGSGGDFTEEDRLAATNFAEAASECHVKRIIYLGGLGDSQEDLSSHLKSRQEVGAILRDKAEGVQVFEFRASIIIGSGSLSFEMIRSLTERLPVMITPKWVWTPAQPIFISDVLSYLEKAITVEVEDNQIFEIGGKDQVSYGDIMVEYARQRNLKRYILHVPVLTPNLSGLWLVLISPLHFRIGRKLIDSARFPTIVTNDTAEKLFQVHPVGVKEAIAAALTNEDQEIAQTRWSDSISSGGRQANWKGVQFGNRLIDSRVIEVNASPREAFIPIRRLGGTNGWYYGNALWHLRGFLDLLVGGVGLKRGRSNPDTLRVGDYLDVWRVEAIEPDHLLKLTAEMKLPGRAWLQFAVEPTSHGSLIRQTALFDPVGLWGLAYWYVLYPIHYFMFRGMLKGIAKQAEKIKNSTQIQSTGSLPE
jgi:uncharacterized protein YbjT (DUF2867 family)